eukprot:1362211-Amphidinium_carterae.1
MYVTVVSKVGTVNTNPPNATIRDALKVLLTGAEKLASPSACERLTCRWRNQWVDKECCRRTSHAEWKHFIHE